MNPLLTDIARTFAKGCAYGLLLLVLFFGTAELLGGIG